MTKAPALRASDVRALTRLVTRALLGVTDIVEGVHQSVWGTIGFQGDPSTGRTRGLTGWVYRRVRGVMQHVGDQLEAGLTGLEPLFAALDERDQTTPIAESARRAALLAALNGVIGDHLAASDNPLATVMHWRRDGQPLDLAATTAGDPLLGGKLLLLIHGLCMYDGQWRGALDHGQSAIALGYTPLYLRYNSGRHISDNGRELAASLEQLLSATPNASAELNVLAHSMGGLLIRSALNVAEQAQMRWPQQLKRVIFLGTPHHGAPLERAGNWVDVLLASTPWSAPFAQLGHLRSAGISDLRYGNVLEADWQGVDRFAKRPDPRMHLPLPTGIKCYAIAASTSTEPSVFGTTLTGDGLVTIQSALGIHAKPERTLVFPRNAQWTAWRTNHLALLDSAAVNAQLLRWLRE